MQIYMNLYTSKENFHDKINENTYIFNIFINYSILILYSYIFISLIGYNLYILTIYTFYFKKRKPRNLVLRHSVSIKTLPCVTFRRILGALSTKRRPSVITLRSSLSAQFYKQCVLSSVTQLMYSLY